MPEGDTIWRAARRIRDSLQGRVIESAGSTAGPALAARVEGAALEEVETRGKHLLLHMSNGSSVHTHLGMQGRWRATRVRRPLSPASAGAVLVPKWLFLETGNTRVICEHAAVIEALSRNDLRAHRVLRDLGPDVLVPSELDTDSAVARTKLFPAATIGELLLDQRVIAGIGNIYRCETLFVCGVDPATPLGAVNDALLHKIVDTASRLMISNLDQRSPNWVYKRAGLACRRCATTILSARLGAHNPRTVYWCPHCQPAWNAAPRPT